MATRMSTLREPSHEPLALKLDLKSEQVCLCSASVPIATSGPHSRRTCGTLPLQSLNPNICSKIQVARNLLTLAGSCAALWPVFEGQGASAMLQGRLQRAEGCPTA